MVKPACVIVSVNQMGMVELNWSVLLKLQRRGLDPMNGWPQPRSLHMPELTVALNGRRSNGD
jgi:hypothetical protein